MRIQRMAAGVPGMGRRWALVALGVLLIGSTGGLRAQERLPEIAPDPGLIERGRDLFGHRWTPNDPRSRGGDGLGPVFNAQSCLDCHDRGGAGGSGHPARKIDIASVAGPESLFRAQAGQNQNQGFNYFYSMSMDLGNGRFEYRIGSPQGQAAANPRRRPVNANANGNANAPRQGNLAPEHLAALEAIHPGFREAPSVVLHRFGVDPEYASWKADVPGRHGPLSVSVSHRMPTSLFGVGLIDALPDEVLEDSARRSGRARATRGRLARTLDGRIGRFGRKGQTATLDEFIRSAAAGELGLEVPGHHQAADPRLPGLGAPGLDLDQSDLDALLAFVRSLPRPTAEVDDELSTRIEAGALAFRSIGCTSCHVPDLGPIEGIYSDLLLHDMGPRLVDTGSYIAFGARPTAAPAGVAALAEGAPAAEHEWRTPPLWGLRDSAPYLHDGRAATLSEAILLHDGQAAPAARRYSQLSSRRKEQLEAFLLSLSAPNPSE